MMGIKSRKETGIIEFLTPTRLMVCALVLVLCIIVLIPFAIADSTAAQSPTQAQPQQKTDSTPTPADEVNAVAQQYMNALLHQQYMQMWTLLHPQIQAQWPDETSFANYWQARFQGFTLKNFTLGKVSDLASWVNPETMKSYTQLKMMPISLQLAAQVAADKIASLPTLDQHPEALFQNLPFIVQQVTDTTKAGNKPAWRILCGGPADPEAPILPPITPTAKTIHVPILMYHHISDVPTTNVLDQSLTVKTSIFGQQLDHLKAKGYQGITFNQLFGALYYNGPLPENPIILTFDDGYEDAYAMAYPALKAHGYSGMFYIITGKVGWQGQATWDQLREMRANGMQIGSHTINHVDLNVTWNNSPDQAEKELQQSRQDLESQLGTIIQQFCYPSGEPFHHGSAQTQQGILTLLEKHGYVGATTDPPPLGTLQDSQKPFELVRVRIDGRSSLESFQATFP